MNKKLLLSFAVFATSLSVNAQKSFSKNERVNNYALSEQTVRTNLNTDFVNTTKKRGPQVITDTLGFFGTKRSYGSPRTSGVYLVPMFESDSIELFSALQKFKNNSPLKFKSIAASMVSLNPNGAKIDVKILDDSFNEIAKVSQDVAYSATAIGTYWFNLDKSVDIKGDFYVSVEPNDVKDSIYLSTTGGYGRNTSATASISGTTLTTTAFQLGTSFWNGQEISGLGITPGTKIVSRTGQNTYTVSISQTVSSGTVLGKNITYGSLDGFLTTAKFPYTSGSKNPDFSKKPNFGQYVLHWDQVNSKPYEADLFLFPVVEYVWNSEPFLDNKCLNNGSVLNVSYTNQDAFNIVKNPLINKMAFWSKYLGYNKSKGYFYSRAFTSNLRDTLDDAANVNKFTFQLTDNTKNDSVTVYDFLLPYGYKVLVATKYFESKFKISSKISANLSTPSAVNCFGDSSIVTISGAQGGFAPYTGTGDRKFAVLADSNKVEIKDANGCILNLDAVIKNSPKKLVATATVTDAKCFGDSASVEVKATGGTGAFTGVGIKKFTATAAITQKIEVLDANKCKATVDATIKAAPAALVVTTKTTDATNNKTTDGTAEATVVGGTSPYTYAWDENSTTAKITKTAGTFKVTVTDANGCKKEATAIIADKKVSITELGLTNVLVYPNPVINTLNVKFDASTIATVELVNVAGQVLNSEVSSDVTFNTSNLASGVYFVNIKVEEGVYTQKIIKE